MARAKRNADCHPSEPHKARGLCRSCYNRRPEAREAARRWALANPDKYRENLRRANYKRTYGITLARFWQTVDEQHGLCAICRTEFNFYVRPKQDHDHESGVVRGVLCQQCNTLLGMAHEKATVLAAAIEYLEKWAA